MLAQFGDTALTSQSHSCLLGLHTFLYTDTQYTSSTFAELHTLQRLVTCVLISLFQNTQLVSHSLMWLFPLDLQLHLRCKRLAFCNEGEERQGHWVEYWTENRVPLSPEPCCSGSVSLEGWVDRAGRCGHIVPVSRPEEGLWFSSKRKTKQNLAKSHITYIYPQCS